MGSAGPRRAAGGNLGKKEDHGSQKARGEHSTNPRNHETMSWSTFGKWNRPSSMPKTGPIGAKNKHLCGLLVFSIAFSRFLWV